MASTTPFSPETVAELQPQVQQLLEEVPSLLCPSSAPPKPLHSVVHHIDTGSAAPVFARPRPLDPEKHRIAEEVFLALEKVSIIRRSNSPWASPLPWSSRRMGRGAPAATIAALTPSQYPTGTPSPTCSPSMTAWPGALLFRKWIKSKPTIAEEDIPKTAKTPFGLWEFCSWLSVSEMQHRPSSSSKTIS
jgi:hypothetical protein